MATEVIDGDRVQRVFDELETQKNILSNCTQLFKSLSNHFTLLEQSIDDKSKSLFSKFATLESESKKTLEALEQRENSIPERESSAAARIEEQKEAALAEFEKTITGDAEFYEILKSYCRKMDCTGLIRFMISKRKESMSLKSVINVAIEESVDLPCLVLDAFEEFISQKSAKVGVPDKRWACGMLIQALFPNAESVEKSSPVFARSVIERAEGVLTLWKEKLCENTEGGSMNGAEATMFLQMVAGFGLVSKFDLDFLRKLVLEFSSRKEMPKVAAALGFGDKLGGMCSKSHSYARFMLFKSIMFLYLRISCSCNMLLTLFGRVQSTTPISLDITELGTVYTSFRYPLFFLVSTLNRSLMLLWISVNIFLIFH